MKPQRLPALDKQEFVQTRDTLHAYARVLGDVLKAHRAKRKHWWHASLRPSLTGLTTGVIRAAVDFELTLDLQASLLRGQTRSGRQLRQELHGQSPNALAATVRGFLAESGIDVGAAPSSGHAESVVPYRPDRARDLAHVLNWVAGAMETFRAGIREETSPIQLWPHHFDLSMLWLPGGRVPDQDPEDEEYADPQMNFGFAFGDQAIEEPYFYVTAYPLPEALPATHLPAGAAWRTEGFNGAVLAYRALLAEADAGACLSMVWSALLAAGRTHMRGHMPSALSQARKPIAQIRGS
jgi:hypothetical protein